MTVKLALVGGGEYFWNISLMICGVVFCSVQQFPASCALYCHTQFWQATCFINKTVNNYINMNIRINNDWIILLCGWVFLICFIYIIFFFVFCFFRYQVHHQQKKHHQHLQQLQQLQHPQQFLEIRWQKWTVNLLLCQARNWTRTSPLRFVSAAYFTLSYWLLIAFCLWLFWWL